MRTITQTLNMAPGGVPPVIHVSQYDSDFTITFTLFSLFGGFTIESGTTAQIRGTKSSGTGYSADAAINISAKTVTVTGDAQMTAAAGQNIFEIVLKKNNKEISSKNFILLCERAALDADTITDESVLKELNAIIEGAETATQAAEEAEDAADRAEAAAQSLVVDPTLTLSGQPADAKTVGDKLALTPYYKGHIQQSTYQSLAEVVSPGTYYVDADMLGFSDTPEHSSGVAFVFRTSYSYVFQAFYPNNHENLYTRTVSRNDYSATDWVEIGSRSQFNPWFTGKKVSIIGDSIDTFDAEGYKIDGYNMYYPHGDITDVKQTWWMQVFAQTKAILEVNASWAGSRVTNTADDPTYPDFYERVGVIGSPDTILITLGTNDSFGGVALGEYDFDSAIADLSESEFRPAYIKGIKALKETYPLATIICIAEKMTPEYKESICNIANYYNAIFIDVDGYAGEEINNALHPNVFGMSQIANSVIRPVDKTLTQNDISADAKVAGEYGLTNEEKTAIIGLLKNATYNKDNRESFDTLCSAFDKSLSYNLKNSDFTRKTGIRFSQNSLYPYYNTQNDRTTYINYGLPLEFGKTYRVKVLVTPKYMATAQMMVVLYDNEFRNAYNTEQSTFNTNVHATGNEWTGLTDDLYVGYTPSYNKVVGMFISVKQAAGQTLSDDFEVLNVQIEEVKDSQSGYLYKLTDGDFLTGYGSPFAVSAAYPFYYKNAYRKTYANFDLIVETGKTYRVIADVPEKYKAVTQMAIEMYDQNLVDAFNNKTATINTKIHTNSRGYLSELTQDVYIGKTRDGDYDCVGFRVMFSVFNSQGELIALPNDFVINSVVVEEVATNKELYTSGGALYGALPVNTNGRKNIIFDTDWMEDVDDAVAVRILSWGVQTGKINLMGAVLDAVDNTSVSSLARFLNYEGLGDVEIGADKQAERTNSTPAKDYHALINNNWSHGKYSTLTDVEDSTTFYRRLLSQTDGKADIISVGFLNALSRLLDSGADEYSTMLGTELVSAKVGTIWVMGGKYPTDSMREFNFGLDELARQASHNFCDKCPVPVVFLGSEVGQNVYSGQTLAETTGTDDLLYKILQVYGVAETGRLSWDPMTALLAIRGSAIRAGYGEIRGTNTVDVSTGINTFTPSNDGKDIYVVKHHTNAWHEYELNQILEKHGW